MRHNSTLFKSFLLGCLLIPLSCQTKPTKDFVIRSEKERLDHSTAEAYGTEYAIATQGRYATKAAEKMFSLGGNIVDATIAASFAISVERPHSTGIGFALPTSLWWIKNEPLFCQNG